MLKFFGISKKTKISQGKITTLFVSVLDEVIINGFVEIQDFPQPKLSRSEFHRYPPLSFL